MKWLLGIKETKQWTEGKTAKEKADILHDTMEKTDKIINNMKTKRVKHARKRNQ